jgi:hypothetical protein
MTTISLKGQRGSLSQRTQDAPRHDALGTTLADIEVNFGRLDSADLVEVRRILEKYVGAPSVNTNQLGITHAGNDAADAVDAARKSATAVAHNISHNQAVGARYKSFWDGKNRELRNSIRR